jgi:hypothetical protein
MQHRDRTIEFIVPAALATMIDEQAIFGPKLGDCLTPFLAVSLSEHLVKIAFDEGFCDIRHSSLTYLRWAISNPAPTSRRYGARGGLKFQDDADNHPRRDLNALRISTANNFGCSKAAKCPPLFSSFQ